VNISDSIRYCSIPIPLWNQMDGIVFDLFAGRGLVIIRYSDQCMMPTQNVRGSGACKVEFANQRPVHRPKSRRPQFRIGSYSSDIRTRIRYRFRTSKFRLASAQYVNVDIRCTYSPVIRRAEMDELRLRLQESCTQTPAGTSVGLDCFR
jgi:hypothetical protein